VIRTRYRTRCRLGAYARVHLPRRHRAPRPRLLRAPGGSRSQLGVVRSLASQSAAHMCEASTWRSALGAPHKQWSMSFLQSHLGEASLRALASIRPPPRDPRTLPALMDPGAPHGLLHSLLPRLARISIGCVRIEPRGETFPTASSAACALYRRNWLGAILVPPLRCIVQSSFECAAFF